MHESQTFETIIEKWAVTLWLLLSLLWIALTYAFTSFGSPVHVLITCLGVVIPYFIGSYVSRADATFVLSHDLLTVTIFCKTLNVTEKRQFYLKEIRGFELNEIKRGNASIIIYLTNFKCKRIWLNKIEDHAGIVAFLNRNLTVVSKNSNTNYRSYGKAFLFASKKCALFLLTCIPTCFLLIDKKQSLNLSMLTQIVCVLSISVLTWYYILNRPTRRNYFRFGALNWFNNIFFFLSPLFLFSIEASYSDYKQKPLRLENINQITNSVATSLYTFASAKYNPSTICVNNYYYGSTSRRSFNVTVNHYFLTPITAGESVVENEIYQVWLAKKFTQKISRRDDVSVKLTKLETYQTKTKLEFDAFFDKNPIFYKAISYDKKAVQTLDGHKNSVDSPIILEPHWEDLSEYRSDLMIRIMQLFATILAANLLGCLLIAGYR